MPSVSAVALAGGRRAQRRRKYIFTAETFEPTHDMRCRWEAGSYGYHGDDGRKYSSSGMGEEYGPVFGSGDVIGAGLHLETQELFFT